MGANDSSVTSTREEKPVHFLIKFYLSARCPYRISCGLSFLDPIPTFIIPRHPYMESRHYKKVDDLDEAAMQASARKCLRLQYLFVACMLMCILVVLGLAASFIRWE